VGFAGRGAAPLTPPPLQPSGPRPPHPFPSPLRTPTPPQDDVIVARQSIISLVAGLLVSGRGARATGRLCRGSSRGGALTPQPAVPPTNPSPQPNPPQFGAGWWVFIDGFAMGSSHLSDAASMGASGYAWLPLFAATLMFIMCVCLG
jgi:membrane-associated phospholipid phosphatase